MIIRTTAAHAMTYAIEAIDDLCGRERRFDLVLGDVKMPTLPMSVEKLVVTFHAYDENASTTNRVIGLYNALTAIVAELAVHVANNPKSFYRTDLGHLANVRDLVAQMLPSK